MMLSGHMFSSFIIRNNFILYFYCILLFFLNVMYILISNLQKMKRCNCPFFRVATLRASISSSFLRNSGGPCEYVSQRCKFLGNLKPWELRFEALSLHATWGSVAPLNFRKIRVSGLLFCSASKFSRNFGNPFPKFLENLKTLNF